jgi:hypothetical protein
MSASPRAVRPGATPIPPAVEPRLATAVSLADRIRALKAEAGALAADQVASMIIGLREAQRGAEDVAEGGAVYPAEVRDLARRLADKVAAKSQTLEILMARAQGAAGRS